MQYSILSFVFSYVLGSSRQAPEDEIQGESESFLEAESQILGMNLDEYLAFRTAGMREAEKQGISFSKWIEEKNRLQKQAG